MAMREEAAVDRIQQLLAPARAAAMDRARLTAAVAQRQLTRLRTLRAALAEGIAPQEAAEVAGDRTPPVAVVEAATAEAADIDNAF
jgi:hypothetical protein